MPVHNGHIALIDFAKLQCDELIVSMSYTDNDPIDASIRFEWLKSIFNNSPGIIIEKIIDDFDDESLSLSARTLLWARFFEGRFPSIDVIISSEDYGASFAEDLGAENIIFDLHRKRVSISATKIRAQPFHYWNFIPPIVRPYFLKKVCFYGAESTGKSSMAEKMAGHYNTEFVPEVAREMITSNDFTADDIIKIGKAQNERIFEKAKKARGVLLCDTDLITTQIYSQYYLDSVPKVLFELEKQVKYDLYFFFDVDVPWVSDGLRDLGNRREEMSKIFRSELEKRNISYVLVQGDWDMRFEIVRKEIDKLIGESVISNL